MGFVKYSGTVERCPLSEVPLYWPILEVTKKKLWTKMCKKESKLQVVPKQKMVFFLLIINTLSI